MGLKRLSLLVLLAFAAAVAVVSVASAGGIRDEPCPTVAGENTNTCPTGTTGTPYSIKFRAVEEPPCAPGDDTWHIVSGVSPPGLTLATDGTLSGTPTEAGIFTFYVEMRLPQYTNPDGSGCNGGADTSQKQFTIPINPGLPKLTIGPESAAPGTVGTPYSLPMTATVADPTVWSINSGALPPGLAIDPSTGVIAGTPTTVGAYTFEVLAKVTADQRSDTKVLGIVVRDPLRILGTAPFTPGRRAPAEVSVPFTATLAATGGEGTYTWSLSTGALPPGLTLFDGTIDGTPTVPGVYQFTATVTDAEGRTANYLGTVTAAAKLAISTLALRPAKVGKPYRTKVALTGGVAPTKLTATGVPRGLRFDKALGVLSGTPSRAGKYRVRFDATDALGVTDAKTLLLKIAAVPKKKRG